MEHIPKGIDFRPAVSVTRFALSPEQVTVNVPTRTLQEIGGAEKITVVAVPQRDLATLPLDSDETVAVRYTLEYPGARDERVTVSPAAGKVSLRLPRRGDCGSGAGRCRYGWRVRRRFWHALMWRCGPSLCG